jgi:hypothetical protein
MELVGTLIDTDTGRKRSPATVQRLAASWAAALATEYGVADGDRVGILALGTTDVFVLQSACGRLGASLVPLSWRAAPNELAEIIASARPKLVLHDELGRTMLGDPTVRCASLADLPATEISARGRVPDADSIAQILFTSGTTGRPRGVVVRWRQLAANAVATALRRLTAAIACSRACRYFTPTCWARHSTPSRAGGTVIVAPLRCRARSTIESRDHRADRRAFRSTSACSTPARPLPRESAARCCRRRRSRRLWSPTASVASCARLRPHRSRAEPVRFRASANPASDGRQAVLTQGKLVGVTVAARAPGRDSY